MICRYCGKPIIGGKGDYWHYKTPYGGYGDMLGADGHLAWPQIEKENSMHTVDSIRALIDQVECKPFQFRLDCVTCVRKGIRISENQDVEGDHQHVLYLQATLWRKDTSNGDFSWGTGGKYFISPHMADGEIVKKCFVAARDYAEHEVREAFKFQGRRVLGPHIDIYTLWNVAEDLEVREPFN